MKRNRSTWPRYGDQERAATGAVCAVTWERRMGSSADVEPAAVVKQGRGGRRSRLRLPDVMWESVSVHHSGPDRKLLLTVKVFRQVLTPVAWRKSCNLGRRPARSVPSANGRVPGVIHEEKHTWTVLRHPRADRRDFSADTAVCDSLVQPGHDAPVESDRRHHRMRGSGFGVRTRRDESPVHPLERSVVDRRRKRAGTPDGGDELPADELRSQPGRPRWSQGPADRIRRLVESGASSARRRNVSRRCACSTQHP